MLRVDLLLIKQGLAKSRSQAQRLIKEGHIHLLEQDSRIPVTKVSIKLPEETQFSVQYQEEDQFVSRGALKLKAALEELPISIKGITALDVGQSTGGFTDCLLQHHAATVVGIEVGHDQLADRLKNDPRVFCYEGINARDIPEDIRSLHAPQGFKLAVMDVSFISQTLIIDSLSRQIANDGWIIALVKPQFELNRGDIGRGGIVKNSAVFSQVEEKIRACYQNHHLKVVRYLESPITGGDGNHEFLLIAQRQMNDH